jgi:CBS domain-containing protein
MLTPMKGHARNMMTERVFSVRPESTLNEIGRAFVAGSITGAPVVDDHQQVIGIISETDLLGAFLREAPETTTAGDLLSQPPIVADEFMPTADVMNLLRSAKIHHLPVVRSGRLVGIITPLDVLRYFVAHDLPILPEDA